MRKLLSRGFQAAFLAGARGVSGAGFLLFSAFVARHYDATVLGYLTLLWATLQGAAILPRQAYDMAILRFAAVAWDNGGAGHARGFLKLATGDVLLPTIVVCAAAMLLCLLPGPAKAFPFLSQSLLSGWLLLPAVALLPVLASFIRALGLAGAGTLIDIGSIPLLACLILLVSRAAIQGGALPGIEPIHALLLAGCLMLALGLALAKFHKPATAVAPSAPDRDRFRAAGRSMLVNQIINYGNVWLGTFLVGFYLSAADVGVYSAASRIAQVSLLMMQALLLLYAPSFARSYAAGDVAWLKKAWLSCAIWSLSFSLPFALVCLFFPSRLLGFFGAGFENGIFSLQILSVGQCLVAAAGGAMMIVNMTGHEDRARLILIGTGVLGVAVALVLIPLYGITGAAIAGAIGLFAQHFVAVIYSVRIVRKLERVGRPGAEA